MDSTLVVVHPHMRRLVETASKAAACDGKVLITGESGTGKDVISRYIHDHSPRRANAFVPVNCAGFPESLLESELFGHVKGSFTGAYRDKPGMLLLAHRGTLFLDEVGEMSLRMQALLLRFLENGEIQTVGASQSPARSDVRLICATNRNLPDLIAAGRFREDLWFRLSVLHLHVPPLRERREEIRPLIEHFMLRLGRLARLSEEAWRVLEQYRWPGNVRELQNIVEQIVWLASDGVVDLDQLPEPVRLSAHPVQPARERRTQIADELYQALVSDGYSFWEHIHPLFLARDITRHDLRELVRRGLAVTRGNYRALLKLFGMPATDYKRFLNFLAAHDCGADFREFRDGASDRPGRPRLVLPVLPAAQMARSRKESFAAAAPGDS